MLNVIPQYLPVIQGVLAVGCFYLGVRNSDFRIKRWAFWVAFVALVLMYKFLEVFLVNYYRIQSTEIGVYVGMALQIIVWSIVVYFYAKIVAGRAQDAGHAKHAAWGIWVPLIGLLWLGLLPSANNIRF